MLRGWIKRLPLAALLLGTMAMLSGCNTISGTVGGVGRDISMIGNTLTGVSGDCRRDRCGSYKQNRRQSRRVVSECSGRGCGGRGYRAPRHERVSYRDRSRRNSSCCR